MSGVIIKKYDTLPISEREIMRYAGAGAPTEEVVSLMREALCESGDVFSYSVCYCESELSVTETICDFGFFQAESKSLSKNLSGCGRAIIFAATVGIGLDRLLARYSRTSPSRALMLQAIGAERIEALCDRFSSDMEASLGKKLRPRFSAGYGDLSIEVQRDIFRVLDASKNIGVSLNRSMLMSPTKSVTAFIGIEE